MTIIIGAHQIASLERHANAAVKQYNADMAAGSEPNFPDWALDLMVLISAHEKLTVRNAELVENEKVLAASLQAAEDARDAMKPALDAADHRLREMAPHYSGLFRQAIDKDIDKIGAALTAAGAV